jgi:hypothetical protein
MRKTLLLIAPLCAVALAAHADALQMPESKTGEAAPLALPAKGASMQTVVKQFGQPAHKHPAAGGGKPEHPPITRWDYDGFSVFFERNHVVDAVIPGQPPPLQHVDELKAN